MTTQEYFSSALRWEVLAGLLSAYIAYGIGLGVYRLYLHPLSKFPGPKLAALTLWYEFYFEIIKRGRFAWEIKRMHEVYGPVVRINPNELHVSDPDFYEELYGGPTRKRDKFKWSANMFGQPNTLLSTVDHDTHKRRRAPVARFFSLQAIRRFDPVIRKKLDAMNHRFTEYQGTGQPVNLTTAFISLTTDIITEYAFGVSYGYLEAEGFNPDWLPVLISASEQSLLHKQVPWFTNTLRKIPLEWMIKIKPEFASFLSITTVINNRIKEIMTGADKIDKNSDQATIFHGLLSGDGPAAELTPEYLEGLGQTIVAAGAITTAHYLKTTMFHLLANPEILQRLSSEMKEVMRDPMVIPPVAELEKLPYFHAVINEGFRISEGIIARLTRVAPDETLEVAGYTIPPGTPIGMSGWLLHGNPTLFPSPKEFKPERWLEPGAEQKEKYLTNFTKGSRICLGKDLAHTEIVYTLCLMVRRWCGDDLKGVELFETTREDVDIAHDFFNPFPKLDSKGMRVSFK
jgi:cytochrome P450